MSHSLTKNRAVQIYNASVAQLFAFFKNTTNLADLYAKTIPLENEQGLLLPVCSLHLDDTRLISDLSRWRKENSFAYPTRFTVTDAGTATWLKKGLLDKQDRMLFLVLDKHGSRVGHVGFANCLNQSRAMEADNILRGDKDAQRGIMTLAMRAMLDWAEEKLGPAEIYLRVFDDNASAIRFYRKLGFKDGTLLPLRLHREGDRETFSPQPPDDTDKPDAHFLRMVYQPERTVDTSQMILTAGPSIAAQECSYVLDATRHGWNTQWSKYLSNFEQSFQEYLPSGPCLATSSCTGAMHLALLALGIGPGDEVIVPDITWVATAQVVNYVGAVPVFADIQPGTWCLDPESLAAKITSQTKAVMPVHLYGHPADMDPILVLAKEHGLYVVEDAAPSIGAEYKGRRTGTFGDFAAFSFQGAKLSITGEGGMLVVNNQDFLDPVKKLWDQGRQPGSFWIDTVGWKYKMSNIQAALGLAQLERTNGLIEAKRRIHDWYAQGLQDAPGLILQQEAHWARSIFWMTNITLTGTAKIGRDEMIAELKARNIDSRPVFPAISQYPIWPRMAKPQPRALEIGNSSINLPSGVCLKQEQVNHVCQVIQEILKQ